METHNKKLFSFKQFSLSDDGCAMKIGTDGLLLGAWAAKFASKNQPLNILDIGTGCGLIALMIAQKTTARITAIDYDLKAYAVADENFRKSPWNSRLNAFHSSLQNFQKGENGAFNLLTCNPPYFENSFLSTQPERNKARHQETLTFDELFAHSDRLMAENANLIIIYPATSYEKIVGLAGSYGLTECSRLNICPAPGQPVKRIISNFTNAKQDNSTKNETIEKFLAIEEDGKRNSFTRDYIMLTQDYHPFL